MVREGRAERAGLEFPQESPGGEGDTGGEGNTGSPDPPPHRKHSWVCSAGAFMAQKALSGKGRRLKEGGGGKLLSAEC